MFTRAAPFPVLLFIRLPRELDGIERFESWAQVQIVPVSAIIGAPHFVFGLVAVRALYLRGIVGRVAVGG